jgi:uncharacterized membrane protein YqhA
MAKLLQSFRYITIIGVIALLIASLDAFAWGCVKALEAIMLVVTSGGKDPEIAISLLEVVDSVLIATALFVFAANLYELFIAEIDLPDWMVAHNLHDLKAKLSSVIVLVMAVKFVEHLVEWKDPLGTLYFGIAVAVVSAVLIAFGHFGEKD